MFRSLICILEVMQANWKWFIQFVIKEEAKIIEIIVGI